MPRQKEASKSEQIAQSGRTATGILRDIADATKSSSLQGLAGVGSMIFEMVDNVKSNREKCFRMTEQVYELVCAVINCCEEAIELAPTFLHAISSLTSTLQKVVSFMQEHTRGNLIKRLLHHQQSATLTEECMSSLQHALALFKLQSGLMTATRMAEMQASAMGRHQELLDMINQPSDLDLLQELRRSSSSVSVLLPGAPKIMHGRQQEIKHVIDALQQNEPAQVAILGPGGIGKTNLALAILHHSTIVDKYGPHRYWIACDSSVSANDLLVVISAYFATGTEPNRLDAILACLKAMIVPVLLVLDNLETPWEQPSKNLQVEELLSHLTGLENVSLMITMRGAERPAQIQWTRPFLPPLGPISTEAARQTFLDISDTDGSDEELNELLSLTDNMPLVVSLLASVAESEGCATTLARWKSESTSLLTGGLDKRSNLEISIEISLHSTRFTSVPHARELLSILSYLPDGITSLEFAQIQLSFSDFEHCRLTLRRTSLAYTTPEDRLKLLVPIKDYIQKSYPPPLSTILSIRNYYFDLVKLAGQLSTISGLLHKFNSNIGNIHFTIQMALNDPVPESVESTLKLLLNLTNLYFITEVRSFDLIHSCHNIIDRMTNKPQLHGHYCMAMYWTIPDLEWKRGETLCFESIEHFKEANDMVSLAWAYQLISRHYGLVVADHDRSFKYAEISLKTALECDDSSVIAWSHYRVAWALEPLHRPGDALRFSEISFLKAHNLGDVYLKLGSLSIQISCHITLGNHHLASRWLPESIILLKALGLDPTSPCGLDICTQRARLHFRKTEYLEASQVHSKIPSRLRKTMISLTSVIKHDIWVPDISNEAIYQQIINLPDAQHDQDAMWIEEAWASYYLHRLRDYKKMEDHCIRALQLGGPKWHDKYAFIGLLAEAAMLKEAISTAEQYLVIFLASSAVNFSVMNIFSSLRHLADVYLILDGDEDTAFNLLEMLLVAYTVRDVHKLRGECLVRLADILNRRGDIGRTKEYLVQAIPLLERSLQHDQVQLCQGRIASLDTATVD
ncbi:hypothetical protein C8J56DRAFT_1120738 [Mycena floridula]|nr:hypothetical protein C8J56DRAFT_1120738 [Mycena floridula]